MDDKMKSANKKEKKRKSTLDIGPSTKKVKVDTVGKDQSLSDDSTALYDSKIKLFNLSLSTSLDTLSDIFTDAEEVEILSDSSGQSLGRAVVYFKNPSLALRALSQHNGKVIDKQCISIQQIVPSKQVFVGHLPKTVTEESLKRHLAASAVVINKNKKFGYVSYSTVDEAIAAIDKYNQTKIDGKEIFLDHPQSLPPSSELYISNLPSDTNQKQLAEAFKNVSSIRMPLKKGKCMGFAFVTFESIKGATKAMKKTESINGQTVFIQYSKPSTVETVREIKLQENISSLSEERQKYLKELERSIEEEKAAKEKAKMAKTAKTLKKVKPKKFETKDDDSDVTMSSILIVRNLNKQTTTEKLHECFPGSLTCVIPKGGGKSKGFGFITYNSIEQATEALQEHNNQLLDGRKMLISYGKPPKEREPTARLKVSNLSEAMTESKIRQHFPKCKKLDVPVSKKTGQPKGFAFLDFDCVADSMSAHDALQNVCLEGNEVTIRYVNKPADSVDGIES